MKRETQTVIEDRERKELLSLDEFQLLKNLTSRRFTNGTILQKPETK